LFDRDGAIDEKKRNKKIALLQTQKSTASSNSITRHSHATKLMNVKVGLRFLSTQNSVFFETVLFHRGSLVVGREVKKKSFQAMMTK
jgi:hypothetical protein